MRKLLSKKDVENTKKAMKLVLNIFYSTFKREELEKAFGEGDLIAMGKCLNVYRKQKKIMAPDSEPDDIREIINSVLSYSYGCCFAGAGGGGYLLAITKEPDMHKQLEGILKKLSYETNGSYTVHRIEVDNEGLIVHTSQ